LDDALENPVVGPLSMEEVCTPNGHGGQGGNDEDVEDVEDEEDEKSKKK
jgi:hypothetical protein